MIYCIKGRKEIYFHIPGSVNRSTNQENCSDLGIGRNSQSFAGRTKDICDICDFENTSKWQM